MPLAYKTHTLGIRWDCKKFYAVSALVQSCFNLSRDSYSAHKMPMWFLLTWDPKAWQEVLKTWWHVTAEQRREWKNNGSAFPRILETEGTVLVIKSGFLHGAHLRICPVILGTAYASQSLVNFFLFKKYALSIKINKMIDNISHLNCSKD